MSKIEDSESKVNTEYIETFRNREEAREALDRVSSTTGLLEELFQDAKKLK